METLVTAISLTLLAGLLLSPPILLSFLKRRKNNNTFIPYFTIGAILTALIIIIFARWSDESDKILLIHYGYSFDGLGDQDYYKNVAPQNAERVRSLVISMSGIGWPLGAIMTYVFYLPYLLLVYVAFYLIELGKKALLRR